MASDESGYREFGSTRWSLIGRAAESDRTSARTALEELLRIYVPAMKRHLVVKRGMEANSADDLVQEFVLKKILERDLIKRVDKKRGRFRSFLLTSLDRFFLDQLRHAKAKKRAPEEMQRLEMDDHPAQAQMSDAFDAAWAQTVVRETLRRMCEDCERKSNGQIWQAFTQRVLFPLIHGTEPLSYEVLVRQCDFASPEQASNALITGKRMFHRHLRSVVGEYADEDEELDSEINDLRVTLARNSCLTADILPEQLTADESVEMDDLSEGSNGSQVARLLSSAFDQEPLWKREELSPLLRHVLGTEIGDLVQVPKDDGVANWGERSLRELFEHDCPPIEVLVAIKHLGRRWAQHSVDGIPADLGGLLYFASIATALTRLDERITKSDDATLQSGLARIAGQPWLDECVAIPLQQCMSRLDSR